ncbi:MAG: CPBP family intramembrane glutamic endopeptidase [Butyribacter sp.]|nr:CPBP family intramembrane metalloprotease [bacterium]MDY3855421.1 CPBP family intramembrane glutamic endopeptidase [Butyribacter sp.]
MEENWKIVRNRACLRALMIFAGIILMQMLAYMVCTVVLMADIMLFHSDNAKAWEELTRANAQNPAFAVTISLVSAVLSMIWCGILYKKSSWRERPFNYKRAFSGKNILAMISGGIGGCMVISIVLTVFCMIFPDLFSSYNSTMENLTTGSTLAALYLLIVGPVSEELIFRGAILDRFYLAFPYWIANICQAALFGIYHMNLIQGLYAFLLGLFLGGIRKKTGSIIPCMLTHILFNATSYFQDYFLPQDTRMRNYVICLLGVAGIAFLVWSIRYLADFSKAESKQNDSEIQNSKKE